MADNVIKAVFASGRRVKTAPLWRYDHGIKLQPIGLELPGNYEMHFSNSETGEAKTVLADASGAVIPAEYLIPGTEVYAWVYLVGDSYGRTKAEIIIPVDAKARPTDQEPTPEQQPVIEQAIDALNNAAGDIQGQIDDALQAAKESGEFDGPPGPQGVADVIWRTAYVGLVYPSGYEAQLSDLVGRSGVEPKVGDLVIGPEPGLVQAGDPTRLYVISYRGGISVDLDYVGSIKGDTGATGATGPAGPQGATGDSGVYIGDTAPTDASVRVWIDTSGGADVTAWEGGSY